MDNKEFGKELERRTKKYAISILKLSAKLPNSIEVKVIKSQMNFWPFLHQLIKT